MTSTTPIPAATLWPYQPAPPPNQPLEALLAGEWEA